MNKIQIGDVQTTKIFFIKELKTFATKFASFIEEFGNNHNSANNGNISAVFEITRQGRPGAHCLKIKSKIYFPLQSW